MSSPVADEQKMRIALHDSEMEPETIDIFIESIRLGRLDSAELILSSHRSQILNEVYDRQNQLYCMDYIIRKIKSKKFE